MDAYVALARNTIESYIRYQKRYRPTREELTEEMLSSQAGAFVSIHEKGQLRGCIGTILPTEKNLVMEIVRNAIAASTRDPRFRPIEVWELPYLDINVDVLTEPEKIKSKDDLDVKRYGVIVEKGRRRGLLLPDLEGVETVEDQISIAKQKAGILEDDPFVTLYRFEVIRHV